MSISRLPRRAIAAALACTAGAALAAPFAVTYTGTIQSSGNLDFPEIINGQAYTVTFVLDNGGSTASGQTWSGSHLTCALWRMNDARNVVYAQDLTATPPTVADGAVTTDAGGALTGMFTDVSTPGEVPAGAYTVSGFAPVAPVRWYANDGNDVFYDAGGGLYRSFGDAAGTAGGVAMSAAHWSAPAPFSGGCSAAPVPPGHAAAVPALHEGGWALLALLLSGVVAARRKLQKR